MMSLEDPQHPLDSVPYSHHYLHTTVEQNALFCNTLDITEKSYKHIQGSRTIQRHTDLSFYSH